MCFIDYEKAFDRVYHQEVMKTLQKTTIDGKDLRIIQSLYWDQIASVRIEGGQSDEFPIQRGVRQGCILSPKLFNLYTENIFEEVDEIEGVKIGGININNLRYADDTALLAESEAQLQKILDEVRIRSENLGLRMNIEKTKVMAVRRTKEERSAKIYIDGKVLEQVKSFKYLGQQITDDGKCETDIRSRIEIARGVFLKMRDVLTSKSLTLKTRKRLVRCYVLSTFLYSAETWTITTDMENKINAFEMWIYRRMLKISYQDHITNEEVLKRVNETPMLLKEIKRRKLQYLGHIIRGDEIQKDLIEGKVEGTRKRGRPRSSWLGEIEKWTGKKMIQLTRLATNRFCWRTMTSKVLEDKGTG